MMPSRSFWDSTAEGSVAGRWLPATMHRSPASLNCTQWKPVLYRNVPTLWRCTTTQRHDKTHTAHDTTHETTHAAHTTWWLMGRGEARRGRGRGEDSGEYHFLGLVGEDGGALAVVPRAQPAGLAHAQQHPLLAHTHRPAQTTSRHHQRVMQRWGSVMPRVCRVCRVACVPRVSCGLRTTPVRQRPCGQRGRSRGARWCSRPTTKHQERDKKRIKTVYKRRSSLCCNVWFYRHIHNAICFGFESYRHPDRLAKFNTKILFNYHTAISWESN